MDKMNKNLKKGNADHLKTYRHSMCYASEKKVKFLDKTSNINYEKYFSAVSFFSGYGGLYLGFLGGLSYKKEDFFSNPFNILAAYDSDPKCIETYKWNISDQITLKDLSNYEPLSMFAADVLIGGFPCRDFATCGPRKGINSERGKLYKSLMHYMDAHSPSIVVGENVPGLANIDGGAALKKTVKDIESCGYRFKVLTLYAPNYGVPQNRTRLFIVGVQNDLPNFPNCPKPEYSGEHRTIRWAIDDLQNIEDETVPNQSQHFKASVAKKGNGQGDETLKPDSPSYTVRANAKSRVQFHYTLARRLSIRECARLQTFSDEFYFSHSATSNIMQIGNAVPPMLAHKVAQEI